MGTLSLAVGLLLLAVLVYAPLPESRLLYPTFVLVNLLAFSALF